MCASGCASGCTSEPVSDLNVVSVSVLAVESKSSHYMQWSTLVSYHHRNAYNFAIEQM